MKTIILMIFLGLGMNGFSQTKEPKTKTVIIQTSAECEQCEDRIETGVNYLKGIVFAELDMQSMKLTVKYKTKKVNLEQIKKEISRLGYTADDIAADPAGLEKLPACCKPGGMGVQQHK